MTERVRSWIVNAWRDSLMSDLIQLEHGVDPWKGSSTSRHVVEYRHYEIPLAGIVEQHGRQYLYFCLSRPDDSPTVWIYTGITSEQRACLEGGPDEQFNERLNGLEHEGRGTLAFATENLGIVDFVEADLDDQGLRLAYRTLLENLDTLRRDAADRLDAIPHLAHAGR